MAYGIGIVEDDRTVRESLELLVDGQRGCRVVFAVGSAEEALREVEAAAPQLAIVDLGLPGLSGVQLIERLALLAPGTDALVLTVYEDDHSVFDALRAGAVGYLVKDISPERLLDAIEETRDGGAPMSPAIARRVVQTFAGTPPPVERVRSWSPLTAREGGILEMLAQGFTYLNASTALGISTHTVHSHIRSIYRKLAVNSRSEAVYEAMRRGLVDLH